MKLVDLPAELADNRRAARACNTRVSLAQGWRKWVEWAAHHGAPELEPAPAELERWLVQHLAGACGYSVRTIELALWAVNATHREHGLPTPGEHPDVKLALAGLRRRLGRGQRRAKPLTWALLERFTFPSTVQGARDKALILLGTAAGLRRSELAALDVEDVQDCADGLLVIVRRSKTDQEGEGAPVLVVPARRTPHLCPVTALGEWLYVCGFARGPLFRSFRGRTAGARISGDTVDKVVKRYAAAAGLGPGYSAHSLRAGMATWLDACGVSIPVIAQQGRWKSYSMVLRYCRGPVAAALRTAY